MRFKLTAALITAVFFTDTVFAQYTDEETSQDLSTDSTTVEPLEEDYGATAPQDETQPPMTPGAQVAPTGEQTTVRQAAQEAKEEDKMPRDIRISVSGVISAARPEVDLNGSSATVDTDTGAGFAAFVQLKWREQEDRENRLIDNIEVGTVLVRSKFQARNGESLMEQEVNRLQFPVLVRTPVGKYFSVGAGPFIGFRVGPTDEKTLVGPGASIDSSLEEDFEAGLMGSVAFRYGFNEWLEGFLDARYSLNFAQTQDVLGFGGLAFRL